MGLVLVVSISGFLPGCSSKSGKSLYGRNCGICHHNGAGMPGEVPPLVGRIDQIAATAQGRHYLASVMMNGVSGPITANGVSYNAEMPPFRSLGNDEVAAILNWLSQKGSVQPAAPMSALDVAQARAERKSAGKVAAERADLDRMYPLP